MRKLRHITTTGLLLTGIITSAISLKAQVPSYQCELTNDSLLTSQIYEFDIYLKNSSAVTFELGNFQAGIHVNPQILNGGTISASIIPGSSQLNAGQQPSEALFSVQENCVKLAPKSPPDFSSGTIIAETDAGTKICRIRLTNTLPFGQGTPDPSFNFTVFPYNTVVSAFDRTTHLNVNITNPVSHMTSGLENPLLNGPVAVYTVSGSGSFCEGSPGLPVILSSTETDIRYQLKKDGINDGGEVNGSGTFLTWANRPAGTYTVTGRRPATYQVTSMTGNAVVEMDEPTSGGVVTGETTITLGALTDTLKLQGHLGDVITWQKQIDNGGYTDIPATAGMTMYQEAPSAAGTWEYHAVVQNRTCLQEFSSSATVVVSAVPLTRSWIGVIDEKWNRSGNWNPAGIPGVQDDVVIPPTAPYMPVVNIQGLSCNNVLVQAGALLTVQPGFILTVNGNITIEE